MDDHERARMRKEIARLRSALAGKKAMLVRLDVEKDERRIQSLINEMTGIEAEIASIEMKL